MKTFAWLIAISLTANILLAGWWMKNHSTFPQLPEAAPPKTTQASVFDSGKVPAAVPVIELTNQAAPVTWSVFQTDDLKELIRRLRAVGCPEGIVQDIICGEVDRLFAPRLRAIWPENNQPRPFWKLQKWNAAESRKNRDRIRQQQEIQKEKSDMLVSLLGVDPEKELLKAEGQPDYSSWPNSQLDFLPETKRDAVEKYLVDFNDKMQDFYARNQGLWDDQARAEQKQLQDQEMQGLGQILTPDELRQFELRNSQLATQLSFDLRGLSLNEQQYEAVYDIRKKYGDSIYNWSGDDNPPDVASQIEQNKKNLDGEIAAALGPDLGKQYHRDQDYSYRQLASLAVRNNLPAGTADRIYDDKDAAEDFLNRIGAVANQFGGVPMEVERVWRGEIPSQHRRRELRARVVRDPDAYVLGPDTEQRLEERVHGEQHADLQHNRLRAVPGQPCDERGDPAGRRMVGRQQGH